MRSVFNPFDLLPFWRGNTRKLAERADLTIEQNRLQRASIDYRIGYTSYINYQLGARMTDHMIPAEAVDAAAPYMLNTEGEK